MQFTSKLSQLYGEMTSKKRSTRVFIVSNLSLNERSWYFAPRTHNCLQLVVVVVEGRRTAYFLCNDIIVFYVSSTVVFLAIWDVWKLLRNNACLAMSLKDAPITARAFFFSQATINEMSGRMKFGKSKRKRPKPRPIEEDDEDIQSPENRSQQNWLDYDGNNTGMIEFLFLLWVWTPFTEERVRILNFQMINFSTSQNPPTLISWKAVMVTRPAENSDWSDTKQFIPQLMEWTRLRIVLGDFEGFLRQKTGVEDDEEKLRYPRKLARQHLKAALSSIPALLQYVLFRNWWKHGAETMMKPRRFWDFLT